jgi:hypothetical protein
VWWTILVLCHHQSAHMLLMNNEDGISGLKGITMICLVF